MFRHENFTIVFPASNSQVSADDPITNITNVIREQYIQGANK